MKYALTMEVKQFRKKDLTSRIFKITIKLGLNTILAIKLLQLVNISMHMIEHQNSIISLVKSQLVKLNQMTGRVDHLFSVDSRDYMLREHREWIENNHVRILWTTTAPFPSVE
uniref:Uncharacterized protein n=2 Tax=Paulinella micropora TaxID=1928728 RepID=A0A1L5YD78_9EUKA|nr:hypothetical protein PCKR_886 [Paulinella micropora]AQX45413.1 hypothetical protein PFK_886 [Paulinella micropora]